MDTASPIEVPTAAADPAVVVPPVLNKSSNSDDDRTVVSDDVSSSGDHFALNKKDHSHPRIVVKVATLLVCLGLLFAVVFTSIHITTNKDKNKNVAPLVPYADDTAAPPEQEEDYNNGMYEDEEDGAAHVVPDDELQDDTDEDDIILTIVNDENAAATPTDDTTTTTTQTTAAATSLSVVNGPYNATMSIFSPELTMGYKDEEDLRSDLTNAFWMLLNFVVSSNTNTNAWNNGNGPGISASVSSANDVKDFDDNTNSYGTNNQEKDVEEGDLMVSDGEYVYAAFGEYLVVWTANDGKEIAKIKVFEDSSILPSIQTLLLHKDRLVVVVIGLEREDDDEDSGDDSSSSSSTSVLDRWGTGTQIRLYDVATMKNIIANGGGMTVNDAQPQLLGLRYINGDYVATRSVEQNVHVITNTNFNTDSFTSKYDIGNYPMYFKDDEYIEQVRIDAESPEDGIPAFVDSFINELRIDAMNLQYLTRIGLFQMNNDSLPDLYHRDLFGSITSVVSFDILENSFIVDDAVTYSTIPATVSGSFMPRWAWPQVYASNDTLIVSGVGSSEDEKGGSYLDTTYLFGRTLVGASAIPTSVGNVTGTLLDSMSVDVVDNGKQLRIATTISDLWSTITADDDETLSNAIENSSTENYIITMDISSSATATTASAQLQQQQPGSIMTELGRVQLGKANERFTAVRFFDNIAYATTYQQIDPVYVIDLTDPTNPTAISELDNITGFSQYLHSMNDDNTMLLSIGQGGGWSTSLKIIIYDATDPTNLKIAHSHEIFANSSSGSTGSTTTYGYLSSEAFWDFHSIRYVDEHLFIPISIDTYDEYYWGYGDDDNDEKNDIEGHFHGYEVYEISVTDGIKRSCRINHATDDDDDQQKQDDDDVDDYVSCCSASWKSLPKRTMIFHGAVTTTYGPHVRSTDLHPGTSSCVRLWDLEVTIDGNETQCCKWDYW